MTKLGIFIYTDHYFYIKTVPYICTTNDGMSLVITGTEERGNYRHLAMHHVSNMINVMGSLMSMDRVVKMYKDLLWINSLLHMILVSLNILPQ